MSAQRDGHGVPKDDDDHLLLFCENWQLSAAAHMGMDPNLRSANCRTMEGHLGNISALTPVSFSGLRAVLTVAATILAARAIDPDGYVASGDAFGLVACALRAAQFGDGEIGGGS